MEKGKERKQIGFTLKKKKQTTKNISQKAYHTVFQPSNFNLTLLANPKKKKEKYSY